MRTSNSHEGNDISLGYVFFPCCVVPTNKHLYCLPVCFSSCTAATSRLTTLLECTIRLYGHHDNISLALLYRSSQQKTQVTAESGNLSHAYFK
jgi:hypothetical protein